MDKRPSWQETFFDTCNTIAKRSTCLKRKVGCVIVKDNRQLSTGYNGVPSKIKHCDVCPRLNCKSGENYDLCNAIHAEQNAICSAARFGIQLLGATLYVNHGVCRVCARFIINTGINKVICKGRLSKEVTDLFKQGDVEYLQVVYND